MLHVLQENPGALGPCNFFFSLFYLVVLAFVELFKKCISKMRKVKADGWLVGD